MDVTSIINAQTPSTTNTQQTTTKSETLADFDVFLNLFVSQLQNQDPLSPMETEDFLAQTAQFSSVEQLVGLNKQVAALAEQNDSMMWTNAASLIGREVYTEADNEDGSSESISGRVVEIGYGSSGDLLLGLEDGTVIPLSSVLSVSES